MCTTHFRRASTLLPTKLTVISIDEERLRCFLVNQVPTYASTIFSKITNLEEPQVINRPAAVMQASGTLQEAMHEFSTAWDLSTSNLRIGQIGCGLAHLEAIQEVANGENITLICEDDMLIDKNKTREAWEAVLIANSTPDRWGVLRIGQHQTAAGPLLAIDDQYQLTMHTRLIWGSWRWGTYGYIVTPIAARAIMTALAAQPELFDTPSDVWLSRIDISEAGGVKSLDPAIVKYRTDVVSTTQM